MKFSSIPLQAGRLAAGVFIWHAHPLTAAPSLEIEVDGMVLSESEGTRIPSSAEKISFHLKDPARQASETFRMRYKLRGHDAGWRQAEGGSHTFTVCFYDRFGNRFGLTTFEVKGTSDGWNDSLGKATFIPRQEKVVVPEGAQKVDLLISSAGSPVSVGVYLTKNILITRAMPSEAGTRIVLDGASAMPSERSNLPGVPQWVRGGTRPSMTEILDLQTEGDPERVLAIVDNDVTGHAEWRLDQNTAPRVTPGEELVVAWKEAYDSTVGGVTSVTYDRLGPGRYQFLAQEVNDWGQPIGAVVSTNLSVSSPYWQNPWFWGGLAVAANLLLALGAYALIRLRARRHLRRTRLLEQERLRIAQDLHDDLGARLTHLSLLSYNACNRMTSPQDRQSFQEFSMVTRDLIAALSQTVWTVNPKNDHLESLVGFLCRMIANQCKVSEMRCRIDALALADRRLIRSETRHHIVLAVKEAVNNAIKHSGSEELHARIGFEAPFLRITISDSGQGFSDSQEWNNGLENMKQRMAEVKGTVTMQSRPGEGTIIFFEIPVS